MAKQKPRESYHHGDLRTALLKAALDLIAEHGLPGLSLRECARRVGVSHAAPYRHFADKDALLMAIAEDGMERLEAAGHEAMKGIDDPRERHDAYGVEYIRFAVENPARLRVMFSSELSPNQRNDADWAMQSGAFKLLAGTVLEMLGGQGDPELGALASWSLVHGLAMLILDGRIPADRIDTSEKMEALTRASFAHWRAMGS